MFFIVCVINRCHRRRLDWLAASEFCKYSVFVIHKIKTWYHNGSHLQLNFNLALLRIQYRVTYTQLLSSSSLVSAKDISGELSTGKAIEHLCSRSSSRLQCSLSAPVKEKQTVYEQRCNRKNIFLWVEGRVTSMIMVFILFCCRVDSYDIVL